MKRGLSPIIAYVLLIILVLIIASIIQLWPLFYPFEKTESNFVYFEKLCSQVKMEVTVLGGYFGQKEIEFEITNFEEIEIDKISIKTISGVDEVTKVIDLKIKPKSTNIYHYTNPLIDVDEFIIYPIILRTEVESLEQKEFTCIENPSRIILKDKIIEKINDTDLDGFSDIEDNCPGDYNPNQEDSDNNGIGDLCDLDSDDLDGDGITNDIDNCPNDSNSDQLDDDYDRIGNICDDFFNDDIDQDNILTLNGDNCPNVSNQYQQDFDSDGEGDLCDETPGISRCDFKTRRLHPNGEYFSNQPRYIEVLTDFGDGGIAYGSLTGSTVNYTDKDDSSTWNVRPEVLCERLANFPPGWFIAFDIERGPYNKPPRCYYPQYMQKQIEYIQAAKSCRPDLYYTFYAVGAGSGASYSLVDSEYNNNPSNPRSRPWVIYQQENCGFSEFMEVVDFLNPSMPISFEGNTEELLPTSWYNFFDSNPPETLGFNEWKSHNEWRIETAARWGKPVIPNIAPYLTHQRLNGTWGYYKVGYPASPELFQETVDYLLNNDLVYGFTFYDNSGRPKPEEESVWTQEVLSGITDTIQSAIDTCKEFNE